MPCCAAHVVTACNTKVLCQNDSGCDCWPIKVCFIKLAAPHQVHQQWHCVAYQLLMPQLLPVLMPQKTQGMLLVVKGLMCLLLLLLLLLLVVAMVVPAIQ
jgi:hypothetical protein